MTSPDPGATPNPWSQPISQPPAEGAALPGASPTYPLSYASMSGPSGPSPLPGHDAPTTTMRGVSSPARGPEHTGTGATVARRAILAAAVVALCGGAAVLTPIALDDARKYTEDEVAAAVAAAEQNARLALLKELSNLEGVGLDVALGAAQVTQLLVQNIVLPVITLFAAVGSGALGVLMGAVTRARDLLNIIPGGGGAAQTLQRLLDMLSAWQNGVKALPQDLTTYANADITSAENYLKALQQKVAAAETATPVPTPTPRF